MTSGIPAVPEPMPVPEPTQVLDLESTVEQATSVASAVVDPPAETPEPPEAWTCACGRPMVVHT